MSSRGLMSDPAARGGRTRMAVTAAVAMVAALLVPVLGQVAPASAATVTQSEISTAEYPIGIAEDAAGNIYLGDAVDQVAANDGLMVVPAKTGTLFGQSVTAGAEHSLVSAGSVSGSIQGVVVDHSGNVFFSTSAGNLYVLPVATGTIFGDSVTANTVRLIETNDGFSGGLDIDSAGNLFAADEATSKVIALPVATGTLYGVATTANQVATLINSSGYWWWDVAVDSNNNLLLTSGWSNAGVYMIPKTTGTFYGQTFSSAGTAGFAVLSKYTADVANGSMKPAGIDVSPSGVVFVAYWSSVVSALAPTDQILFGTTVPALTATRLSATGSGYSNQGVMFSSTNDLITGGSSATWRIRTSATASPNTGSTSGGTTVTFGGLSGCVNVIEAYLADGTKVTPANSCSSTGGTSVNLTMPAHAAGAQTLYVEWQSATATYLYPATFTYGTPPSISSISPKSGSTSGGAVVTISGSFTNGVTGVTIGGTSASITSSNASSVTVVVPMGTAGAASVAVTNAYGTSTLSNAFTYATGPVITSLSPASGAPAGGTVVRITGSGLSDVIQVTFGGTAGTSLTIDSSTSLVVTTPSAPTGTSGTAVNVAASNGPNTSTLTSAFSYNGPVVSSVSPATGSTSGSTAVYINGTNLSTCTGATFGGVAATGVSYDSTNTRLNATTPAGTAGHVSVAVSCASSTGYTLSSAFTYGAPPTLTSISPSTIWASGGESVTITGTNFSNASAVTFGGTNATSFTVISSTSITAKAPAKSGAQTVVVTTPYGTASGSVTYQTAPTVSAVAPTTRSTAGGQLVSISGTGFSDDATVTFGGTSATSVSVVSSTLIRATTPAKSAGAAAVVVTTAGGGSNSSESLTFEAPPTITSISPTSGDIAGGTSVTITGTNFTGTGEVTIGGAPATSVVVVNSTTVTAVTPAGSSGAAGLTLATGAGLVHETSAFTYTGGSSGGGGGGGSSSSSSTASATPTPTESAAPVVPTTAPTADPANAGLRPGAVNVLIGGQETPVSSRENKARGTVSISGDGWATTFGSRSGSKPVPLGPGGALSLQPGKQTTISVAGFAPGSTLGVSLLSSPVSLGTIPVDAAGAATESLKVPASMPAGRHTLQLNGYSATGELRSIAVGVVVAKGASNTTSSVKRAMVTFEPNSSTLSSSDKKALSNMLAKVPKGATIAATSVGYAYGSNSDGSAETLAKARAKSVLKYLSQSRKLASSKAVGKVLPVSSQPGQARLTLTYS